MEAGPEAVPQRAPGEVTRLAYYSICMFSKAGSREFRSKWVGSETPKVYSRIFTTRYIQDEDPYGMKTGAGL